MRLCFREYFDYHPVFCWTYFCEMEIVLQLAWCFGIFLFEIRKKRGLCYFHIHYWWYLYYHLVYTESLLLIYKCKKKKFQKLVHIYRETLRHYIRYSHMHYRCYLNYNLVYANPLLLIYELKKKKKLQKSVYIFRENWTSLVSDGQVCKYGGLKYRQTQIFLLISSSLK